MKQLLTLMLAALLLCGCLPRTATPANKSMRFVYHLSRGEFETASQSFDPTVQAALPPDKLAQVWKQLESQLGKFVSSGPPRMEKIAGLDAAFVPCRFGNRIIEAKLVFDAQGRVTGLFFVLPGGK